MIKVNADDKWSGRFTIENMITVNADDPKVEFIFHISCFEFCFEIDFLYERVTQKYY